MSSLIFLKNANQFLKHRALNLTRSFALSASLNDHNLNHYDVIIAGGGLVGVGLAASLGKLIGIFTSYL